MSVFHFFLTWRGSWFHRIISFTFFIGWQMRLFIRWKMFRCQFIISKEMIFYSEILFLFFVVADIVDSDVIFRWFFSKLLIRIIFMSKIVYIFSLSWLIWMFVLIWILIVWLKVNMTYNNFLFLLWCCDFTIFISYWNWINTWGFRSLLFLFCRWLSYFIWILLLFLFFDRFNFRLWNLKWSLLYLNEFLLQCFKSLLENLKWCDIVLFRLDWLIILFEFLYLHL